MPYTDLETRRAYMREYQRQYREKLALYRRGLRQQNLEHDRERATAKNRAKGHRAPTGPRVGKNVQRRIVVSTGRRWRLLDGLIYCNTTIGLSEEEVCGMLKALRMYKLATVEVTTE